MAVRQVLVTGNSYKKVCGVESGAGPPYCHVINNNRERARERESRKIFSFSAPRFSVQILNFLLTIPNNVFHRTLWLNYND